MQTWELAARIALAYFIIGLSLATVWAFWKSAETVGQPTTTWKKVGVFVLLTLTSPLLLVTIAVIALWTWDLWEPLQRIREMEKKEGIDSTDP